jgi:hypothetical protein
MIISAPFDSWWHNAYGLDVAILSPPHVLLMTGSVAISIGSLILIGGAMNRSEGRQRTMLRGLFLYVGGIVVIHACFLFSEYAGSETLHGATTYLVISLAVPLALVGVARASEQPCPHRRNHRQDCHRGSWRHGNECRNVHSYSVRPTKFAESTSQRAYSKTHSTRKFEKDFQQFDAGVCSGHLDGHLRRRPDEEGRH